MLAYSKGYYYMAEETYSIKTPITGYLVLDVYYSLSKQGLIEIYRGYAWDGPTGYLKLNSLIRPSAIHDVLCQMMREEKIPHDLYPVANQIFYEECLKSGLNKVHAKIIKLAVDLFKPGNPKKGLVHPTMYAR